MEFKSSKSGETKRSFNVIDVFILIFVVVCFVGVVIRIVNLDIFNNDQELEEYRIHFSVSNVASTSEEYFKTGDHVSIAGQNISLGRIEMINTIEPAVMYVKNTEGEMVSVRYPSNTRVDIKGTLISEGTTDKVGYKLGGETYITPGETYSVQSEHMDFVLTVTDIVRK